MSPSSPVMRWLAAAVGMAVLMLAACSSLPMAKVPSGEGLRPAAVWLLGEVHDSPHAHEARWRDLAQRVHKGWRPVLVMEQFDRDRQAALDMAMAACADAACVVQRAGGDGWDWPLLTPVLQLALQYRLPVVAANVSRADAARVVREGIGAALAPDLLQRFGWPGSLTPGVRAALELAVDQGHCGQLPKGLIARMATAQVARDIWMAEQLRQHAVHGAVLLAGNGHVRSDAGVPHWLRQVGVQDIQAVGYEEQGIEVPAGHYDQLRRIPLHPRSDPCASLRMGSGAAR